MAKFKGVITQYTEVTYHFEIEADSEEEARDMLEDEYDLSGFKEVDDSYENKIDEIYEEDENN